MGRKVARAFLFFAGGRWSLVANGGGWQWLGMVESVAAGGGLEKM